MRHSYKSPGGVRSKKLEIPGELNHSPGVASAQANGGGSGKANRSGIGGTAGQLGKGDQYTHHPIKGGYIGASLGASGAALAAGFAVAGHDGTPI